MPAKPHRLIERLKPEEHELLSRILASPIGAGWPRAWWELADDRLRLAQDHLAVASALLSSSSQPLGRDERLRSVISRAYYAMFAASRAALSFEGKGDVNDHQRIPAQIDKTSNLGSESERRKVVAALNKFRALRNEADYSAYYPASLARDAREAVAAAKRVLRLCSRWVRNTKKARGIK